MFYILFFLFILSSDSRAMNLPLEYLQVTNNFIKQRAKKNNGSRITDPKFLFPKMNNDHDCYVLSQGLSVDGFINQQYMNKIRKVLLEIKKQYPKVENIHTRGKFKITEFYLEFKENSIQHIKHYLEQLKKVPYPIHYVGLEGTKIKIIFECPMDIIGLCAAINNKYSGVEASPIYYLIPFNNIEIKFINSDLWQFDFQKIIFEENKGKKYTVTFLYHLDTDFIEKGNECVKDML